MRSIVFEGGGAPATTTRMRPAPGTASPRAFRAARDNPLTLFAQPAYELPLIRLRHMTIVSEPAAIERVLVDNAGNYIKSRLQQRRIHAPVGRRAR